MKQMRTCPWRGSWTWSVNNSQEATDRVELNLNRLRCLYLEAIWLSPNLRNSPARALSSAFNGAFLSLAGLDQSTIWQDLGFSPVARYGLDWEGVRRDLASALTHLTQNPNAKTTYAEAMAMKPGFHEAWVHEGFPGDAQDGPETARGRVFAILRGSPLELLELVDHYPMDLSDPDTFLRYAPCAVTEGPLVRRKGPGVSYFAELKRVGTVPAIAMRQTILLESFQVLDARQRLRQENHAAVLERIIQDVEGFNLLESS